MSESLDKAVAANRRAAEAAGIAFDEAIVRHWLQGRFVGIAPAPATASNDSPALPPESDALAIIRVCPHARLCDCASRGMVDCQSTGRRPGQRLAPAECRACLAEFRQRAIETGTVTIAVLVVDPSVWESHLRPWLDAQPRPRDDRRLVLVDVSCDGQALDPAREWIAGGSFGQVEQFPIFVRTQDDLRTLRDQLARDARTEFLFIRTCYKQTPFDAVELLLDAIGETAAAAVGSLGAGAVAVDDQADVGFAMGSDEWGMLVRLVSVETDAVGEVS